MLCSAEVPKSRFCMQGLMHLVGFNTFPNFRLLCDHSCGVHPPTPLLLDLHLFFTPEVLPWYACKRKWMTARIIHGTLRNLVLL